MKPTRTVELVRYRSLADAGSKTLFFKMSAGRRGVFLDPCDVPEHEGERTYWMVEKLPRGLWRFIRQVEKPAWMQQ